MTAPGAPVPGAPVPGAGFERAVARVAERLGPERLRALAAGIERGGPAVAGAVPVPGFADAARTVLDAQARDAVPDAQAVAYLRGVAAGYALRSDGLRVESVWSGPASHPVPVRATAQVLTDLVAGATGELLLMTYSARPYPPLHDALAAAVARGVAVDVVVETLAGAGSALAGAEPAAAFGSIPGVALWHWPLTRREPGAKMHAKLAVADRRVLLVSSANLTASGAGRNVEAGVLIRGGAAPRRAAEHVAELRATGMLTRLYPGS